MSFAQDAATFGKSGFSCDVEEEQSLRHEQAHLQSSLLFERSLEKALAESSNVQAKQLSTAHGAMREVSFEQLCLRLTSLQDHKADRSSCASAEAELIAFLQAEEEESAALKSNEHRADYLMARSISYISSLEDELAFAQRTEAAERDNARCERDLRSLLAENQALRDERDGISDRLALLKAAMRVCAPTHPVKHSRKQSPVLRSSTNTNRSSCPSTPELTHSPNFSPWSPPDCPLPPTPVAGPSPLVHIEDDDDEIFEPEAGFG